MGSLRNSIAKMRPWSLVTMLLVSVAVAACSKPPPALSEAELLTLLAAAKRQGPYQFRQQTWPQLEKKLISYCGQLDQVKTTDADFLLLIKVDKPHNGEPLPWTLEGKIASIELARAPQPEDAVCMTGTFEGFMESDRKYWGYIKISALTKPTVS